MAFRRRSRRPGRGRPVRGRSRRRSSSRRRRGSTTRPLRVGWRM